MVVPNTETGGVRLLEERQNQGLYVGTLVTSLEHVLCGARELHVAWVFIPLQTPGISAEAAPQSLHGDTILNQKRMEPLGDKGLCAWTCPTSLSRAIPEGLQEDRVRPSFPP